MDGLYVVRTSLAEGELDAEDTVRAYKLLPQPQDRGSQGATRLSPHRRAGPCARVAVRVGLLRGMAHVRPAGAAAVRRPRSGGRRGGAHVHRGAGTSLPGGQGESPEQTHRCRLARAQLPQPARRPSDDRQEPRRPSSAQRRTVPGPHVAHRTTAGSLKMARRAS